MKYNVKHQQIPNPVVHSSWVLIWLQDIQGLTKETGLSSYKELNTPPSGTPANFMSKNCGPRGWRYLQKWQNLK